MGISPSCFTRKRSYILLLLFFFYSGIVGFSFDNEGKTFVEESKGLYSQMHLASAGLNFDAFNTAVDGWKKLQSSFGLNNILSIADFSQSSRQKRLFVIDMENKKLLYQTFVAHGRNSGEEFAQSFSNDAESYKSSLGFYMTGETYSGKHGLSLQLKGLEPGVNDKAEKRAIVIHGADYVSESFVRKFGRLGRSLGCPAVPIELCKPIVETLKGGSCFFIYSSNRGKIVL